MIAWVDVETTGLDEESGRLLEVALVATDDDLKEVACRSLVVCGPALTDVTGELDDFKVFAMHHKSGLLDEVGQSTATLTHVEHELCAFVAQYVPEPGKTPLAGSTVGFDRRWLRRHMPVLESAFSYRSIDVSSITELAKRWAPAVYEGRPKAGAAHRALADVRDSIEYLRYYRRCGFLATPSPLVVPTVPPGTHLPDSAVQP